MKKLLLSVAVLATTLSFAQEDHNHGWCGFDHQLEQQFQEDPSRAQALHEWMLSIKGNGQELLQSRSTFTVPVVVHVVHSGGSGNISYDQVVSAIDQLNEDWNRLNPDTSQTRDTPMAPFKPVAADMSIEFKLARLDESGNCTNGVERRLSGGAAVNADDDVKHYGSGGLDAWDPDSYFNIWVVESIDAGVGGGGIVLGYAQFPGGWGAANEYGLVIRNDAFGTMGTANGDRTLAHEVGHCFGLFHTFQGGCGEGGGWNGNNTNDCTQGGDYICDTPPQDEAHWTCGATQDHCTSVTNNDFWGTNVYDQYENFMSYAPCQNMFSEGQKSSVYDVIASVNMLQNLTSAANLTATGVDQPDQLCSAEFTSSNNVICAGNTIDFADQSYFGVTGVNWTFTGGTPATSTSSNPSITYNTPGIYDVTLEVTDGTNNQSSTQVGYVVVLDDPGAPVPYSEGFESVSSVPDGTGWFVQDDQGNNPFELNTQYGSSGTNSAWLDNFGVSDGSSDHLISGPIDLSGISAGDSYVMTFKYAYKKRSASNDEWLWIKVSDDCGETWTTKKVIHGDNLNSQTSTGPFYPTEEDWIEVTVPGINSQYWISNFRYKFRFDNDTGNNIYIDDINIYPASMTSIQEEIADNLTVYPNPVSNMMNITMDTYESAFYTITLTNALGQQVAVVYQGEIAAGQNKVSYDMESLPQGAYFLNIESNGVVKTTKVMKQ